jgi:hypothetical protein
MKKLTVLPSGGRVSSDVHSLRRTRRIPALGEDVKAALKTLTLSARNGSWVGISAYKPIYGYADIWCVGRAQTWSALKDGQNQVVALGSALCKECIRLRSTL